MLKPLIKQGLNFLYPPTCLVCRENSLEDNLLCHKCWSKFQFISSPYCASCGCPFSFEVSRDALCGKCIASPPKYDAARHLFKYEYLSKKLIFALKYNDQTYLAKIFAELLFKKYNTEIIKYDLIVPVPMHWLKRIFRMYNQASLLAIEISKCSNIQIKHDILIKNKWTKAQSSLRREARQNNLRGSIQVDNANFLKGKNIILVDDVLTTGATVRECCNQLRKNGAKNILVLTVAAT
jgi:ComF family protein